MPTVTGQPGGGRPPSPRGRSGLSVNVEDETEPCTEPPGFVCRQDPDPGTPGP